jgi:hypothetical protein
VRTEEISRRSLIAAIAACGTLLVASVAASVYLAQHRESLNVSADAGDAEFRRVRARFAGQQPLLDMDAREVAAEPAPGAAPPRIRAFHTMILDTRGGTRLVHLTAPPAFARLFAHRDGFYRWLGELTFLDDTEFDPEPIHLSFEAIRRRGPGLLVDYRHPGGGQFIAWVE